MQPPRSLPVVGSRNGRVTGVNEYPLFLLPASPGHEKKAPKPRLAGWFQIRNVATRRLAGKVGQAMSFMHERSKSPGLIGEWSATRTFEPGSRFSRSRSDIHATEFGSASISSDHDVNGRSQYDGSARQASIKQSQGRIQSALPVYLLWATVGGPASDVEAIGDQHCDAYGSDPDDK